MQILEKDFKVTGDYYNNIRVSCDYESRRYRLYATPERIEDEGVYQVRKTNSDALFNSVCQTIITIPGRKSKKTDAEALSRIDINSALNTICERFNLKLAE